MRHGFSTYLQKRARPESRAQTLVVPESPPNFCSKQLKLVFEADHLPPELASC
jgi:hypothetical protein